MGWVLMSDNNKVGLFAGLLGDFRPVPRVFLALGVVVLLMGAPSGFKASNRTLMVGISLFAAGIAGNYWPEATFGPIYAGDQSSRGVRWGNVFLALLFSAICAWTSYLACLGQ
jgi:hypothetical protein